MKKTLSLLLVLTMLLCWGCGEKPNPEIKKQMDSALETVNSETKLNCEYMLEITFGNGAVLYYAKGSAFWDREKLKAETLFDQTYLGNSVKMENYFSDGIMYSLENGVPLKVERDGEVLLSKFPYFKIPSCGEETVISVGNNSAGTSYKFSTADAKWLCEEILGGDIYALATVIKKPQPEKTKYSDAQYTYTEKDGRLVSARYEFDIKLFDTPTVSANYTPPESEYTLDLHFVAKVEYKGFGEDVSIKDYSAPEEK